MDHAGVVRGLEPLGDLAADIHRFLDRKRSASNAIFERLPRHELQHQEASVLGLVDAVDLRDVGMVQSSDRLGLALEPSQPLVILREVFRKDLDRHLAIQSRVLRPVDLPHGTGP